MGSVNASKEIKDLFPPERAAENFYMLSMKYFDQNFGTFPKAEIDQMMFSFIYEAMKEDKRLVQGRLSAGNAKTGDPATLAVAIQLGITPSRVESYIEKREIRKASLKDQGKTWWQTIRKVLTSSVAYIDEGKVFFVLPNKFLRHELTQALDQGGFYYDYSFNKRVFVVPCSVFVSLVFDIYFQKEGITSTDLSFSHFEAQFRRNFKLSTEEWDSIRDSVEAMYDNRKKPQKYHAACMSAGSLLSGITAAVKAAGRVIGVSFD